MGRFCKSPLFYRLNFKQEKMTYQEYRNTFDEVLSNPTPSAPYDNPDYIDYTKLNLSRHDRWIKKGVILPELEEIIKAIKEDLSWVLISESWCGDAAHITPFIFKLSELNDLIKLKVQLRDTDSEIDNYLTNGGKSIPILVVRDRHGKDLFTWEPRPKQAQEIHLRNLASDKPVKEKKIELQSWYNKDKGESFQKEMLQYFEML